MIKLSYRDKIITLNHGKFTGDKEIVKLFSLVDLPIDYYPDYDLALANEIVKVYKATIISYQRQDYNKKHIY